MDKEDQILQRLDKVIALLQIAHSNAIEGVRTKVRSDSGYKTILETTKDWTGAAKVMGAASKAGIARSTTSRKIAELIERGMLAKRGAGSAIEYRSTGLI